MESLPKSVNKESFSGFDMMDSEVPDGTCRRVAIELKHVFEGMVADADEANEEFFLSQDLEHALRRLMVDPSQSSLDYLLDVSPALLEPVKTIQQLVTPRMLES